MSALRGSRGCENPLSSTTRETTVNKPRHLLLATSVAAMALTGCAKEAPAPAADVAATETAPVTTAAPAETPDMATAFRTFLDENWADDLVRFPTFASYVGDKTNQDKWNTV